MYSCAVLCLLGMALPVVAQIIPPPPDPLASGYYKDNAERFHAYIFRTYTDPAKLAWLLMDSGMDQWSRAPHQWGRSAESYSYRVASGWGRRIVRNTAQYGLETLLQEDSRYRRSGEGRIAKRMLFAVSHSVLAYKPNGSVEPMYGRIAAGVVGAATASTWHPQSIRPECLFRGMGMAAVDRAGDNLLQEFGPELKLFGRKTWNQLLRK